MNSKKRSIWCCSHESAHQPTQWKTKLEPEQPMKTKKKGGKPNQVKEGKAPWFFDSLSGSTLPPKKERKGGALILARVEEVPTSAAAI